MEVPASAPQLGHEVPDSKPPKAGEDSTAAAATAATTVASANQDGRKRKLDHDGFRMSKYFKICSIVKEMRPFFVEVSRTPNFRDGKVSHEIQIRMKSLIELTKQLRTETSIAKCCETPAKEPLSVVVKEENIEKHPEGHKQALPPPLPGEDPAASVNAIENGIREKNEGLEELQNINEREFTEPFLVGASPIGWNFLVYPGKKPVFYGISKETTLAQRAKTE
ncbi:hypothetical protein KFK09_010603 [Dendrobium nobile]|uniref:Uncharacterized protein n=1 Tax=Dendrobium nobile TaxID=94219 RepID=A0A8T3BC78_DENNO|nr:hypothetical protein KFK09_010603 [Dendrobium nobile]